MLDMSRNAVMHVPALKNFIITLSDMGYNTLLLYTEDTYEIPGEPYSVTSGAATPSRSYGKS